MHGRHLGDECGEGRGVAACFGENASAVVGHRQVAIFCRADDTEAVFDAAHDSDVSVPGAVQIEIPPRNQH